MLTPAKAEEILGKSKGGRWLRSPARYLGYFDEALALLRKGWCQGAFARNFRGTKLESAKDRTARSYCAVGALERVTPEYRDHKVCKLLLAYAMGVLPNGRWTIAAVNDGPNKQTAKAEVLAGYQNARTVLIALVNQGQA